MFHDNANLGILVARICTFAGAKNIRREPATPFVSTDELKKMSLVNNLFSPPSSVFPVLESMPRCREITEPIG
jgi:hypothetical protein